MKKDEKNRRTDRYEYKVAWSEEDRVYIGRVAEFPSLAAHGDNPESALKEIQFVVSAVLEDLEGEIAPEPLSAKKFSGTLNVRMPEYLHRHLASEAAWQKVSLNQLIVSKLAGKVNQIALPGNVLEKKR